jgi:guanosine-3',5'-bis(diphosphate) 3'-pyrophosphohydrolase
MIENHLYRIEAIKAHKAQSYAGFPYAVHLAAVELVLRDFEYVTYRWKAAAWLHDILEDCQDSWPVERLSNEFGDRVSQLVFAVSGFGANRKERNACIYAKIKEYPEAGILKVADRIANVEFSAGERKDGIREMYKREFPDFFMNVNSAAVPDTMWSRLTAALNGV